MFCRSTDRHWHRRESFSRIQSIAGSSFPCSPHNVLNQKNIRRDPGYIDPAKFTTTNGEKTEYISTTFITKCWLQMWGKPTRTRRLSPRHRGTCYISWSGHRECRGRVMQITPTLDTEDKAMMTRKLFSFLHPSSHRSHTSSNRV